jgi:hypothetical protein
LRGKLQEKNVRTRQQGGIQLSYVEGWHTIDEANRVFGFDGWDRETIAVERVWEDGRFATKACAYTARVRIRVRAGETVVCRDGSGFGHATGSTLGEAHENALKEAETDATKRALVTFGNLFGLTLYDREQQGLRRSGKAKGRIEGFHWPLISEVGELLSRHSGPEVFCASLRSLIGATNTRESLEGLWLQNGAAIRELRGRCPQLKTAQGRHYAEILESIYQQRLLDLTDGGQEVTRPGIDKFELTLALPKRVRDAAHLKFVASIPCLICGRRPSQAHHLRFAQPRSLGSKVSDQYTVPLCAVHHRTLHDHGAEENWWQSHGITPLEEAERLWRENHQETPNTVASDASVASTAAQ